MYYERIAENRKHGFNTSEEAFIKTWNQRSMRGTHGRVHGLNLFELFRNKDLEKNLTVNWRDRLVAATIIQWLGSNCGMSFLKAALSACGYAIVPLKEEPAQMFTHIITDGKCDICKGAGIIPADRYGAGKTCQCKRMN